jgi:hypothetical protein
VKEGVRNSWNELGSDIFRCIMDVERPPSLPQGIVSLILSVHRNCCGH